MYSPYLPSPKWPISPILILSLTQIHFFHKLLILHSFDVTILAQVVHFHPFHHSTLHSICIHTHAIFLVNALIAFTVPFWHSTSTSHIAHFYSKLFDWCVLFHLHNSCKKILLLRPLSTSVDIPSLHNSCIWSYNTPLSYFCFHFLGREYPLVLNSFTSFILSPLGTVSHTPTYGTLTL